jgi:type I restriction enzyme S subunit
MISFKYFSEATLTYPSLPEQQKIASFLTSVDTKIFQLKKKKSLLEKYKKGIMQKIFSQELRFKDENGKEFPEWKRKKLGEVMSKTPSNIAANKIEDNFGEYIIYGASGILKRVDFFQESEKYISIVKDGAGVGRVYLCEANTSVLGTLDILKPIETNLEFLFYLLQQINFSKHITGSTIPHIYYSNYKVEKVFVPSIPEQTKIANFLSAIDDKINLCTSQIEKAEQWKKGLMQRMFC